LNRFRYFHPLVEPPKTPPLFNPSVVSELPKQDEPRIALLRYRQGPKYPRN
jgi:hypothetical protein